MKLSSSTVVGTTTEGAPVTWGQVEDSVCELREWLSLKLSTGACTTRLVHELAGHWCRMPQVLDDHLLLVDVHAVLDQIGAMEKAGLNRAVRTKCEEPFKGLLTGLWHKHWFQASFMFHNLAAELDQRGMAPVFKRLNDRFGKQGWVGRVVDNEIVGLMTHAIVEDSFENRAGSTGRGAKSRLTGEWIVFAKCSGRNIYLTLGAHAEHDEAILERCCSAVREFPELRGIEPFRSAGL